MANKFLVIETDGSFKIVNDPGNRAGRDALKEQYIGAVTDRRCVSRYPFLLYAVVNDTGLLDGLPMQRCDLLAGLAGPVLLYLDTGEIWRGFGD